MTKRKAPTNYQRMSKRELEVLIAMAEGLMPKSIARRHGLSVKTISTYRARIQLKTGLTTNSQMALLAFQLDLVSGIDPVVLREIKDVHSNKELKSVRTSTAGEQASGDDNGSNTPSASAAQPVGGV